MAASREVSFRSAPLRSASLHYTSRGYLIQLPNYLHKELNATVCEAVVVCVPIAHCTCIVDECFIVER
jgi:hypothetical protein